MSPPGAESIWIYKRILKIAGLWLGAKTSIDTVLQSAELLSIPHVDVRKLVFCS